MTARANAKATAAALFARIACSRSRICSEAIQAVGAAAILLLALPTGGLGQARASDPATRQLPATAASARAPAKTEIAAGQSTPVTLVRSGGPWKLALSADFEGNVLDEAVWTTCYWWNDGGCTNLGNHELEWYQPDNVVLADGHLNLVARSQTATGWKGQRFDYTSGMVTTGLYENEHRAVARFVFQYGLVEVRAKLPQGKGLWPAIWLLPETLGARPEIDIMEMLGDSPNRLQVHLHYDAPDHSAREAGQTIRTANLAKSWHVFGLRWEPKSITWYLDGVQVWRYAHAGSIPKQPMYLLINLAVGGDFPGPPAPTTRFPAEMLIDHVKVWQRASQ
jgi:beta-glucanase (GH16 family)